MSESEINDCCVQLLDPDSVFIKLFQKYVQYYLHDISINLFENKDSIRIICSAI